MLVILDILIADCLLSDPQQNHNSIHDEGMMLLPDPLVVYQINAFSFAFLLSVALPAFVLSVPFPGLRQYLLFFISLNIFLYPYLVCCVP